MAIESFLLFIAVAILPAISPGPAILLALSNSLRHGPRSVIYSALGNTLGLTILGFAVAFGLATILSVSVAAFMVVKIIGAAYLIYLGVKLWRDGQAVSLSGVAGPPLSRGKLFRQALIVSLTNPKALVILAALIPPFVDRAQPVVLQVAILSMTYAGLCFANHLLIAFAGGKIRQLLLFETRMIAVRRVLGAMFIGLGAALAAANR